MGYLKARDDSFGSFKIMPIDWSYFADFFRKLFGRDHFDAAAFVGGFQTGQLWGQLLLALLLLGGSFAVATWLMGKDRHIAAHHALLRHLAHRLCWPFLLFVSSAVAIALYDGEPVCLYLLAALARWMMLIRAVLALLGSLFPNSNLMRRAEYGLSGILWVFFVLWLSGLEVWLIQWLKDLSFSVGSTSISVYAVLSGLFWIGVLMVGALWLSRYISQLLQQRTHLDASLQLMLSKIITSVLMVLSVLISLPLVGIDLTVLSVFGGALGVGLGFGLQKIASNYISGFIILGERSIRPGDRISVSGITGYISTITSRFVVLRSSNGQEALIPNETFISSTVINESYSTRSLWQSLDLQVAYDTDLPKALAILQQVAAQQTRVQQDPPPRAFVVGFGDNGINLKIGFWVRDPENGFLGLNSDILLDIWQQFTQAGIEFPYPQREVRLLTDPPPNKES